MSSFDTSDDSALESDISSLLSDDDRMAVDDPMSVEDPHLFDVSSARHSMSQSSLAQRQQTAKSTQRQSDRVPMGRAIAPHENARLSTRRVRKPPAKFAAAASACGTIKTSTIGDIGKTRTSKSQAPVPSTAAKKQSSPPVQPTSLASSCGQSAASKKDRLLMRQWLIMMANTTQITNMTWYNEEHTQIRIPWKHGSRSCWTLDDCQLYKAWAKHTGKYSEAQVDEPKRWKANFRCALNSLPDVHEVKNAGQTRGNNPFKVYELSQEVNKKNYVKRTRKSRRPKGDNAVKQELPLAAVSTHGRARSTSKVHKAEISNAVLQISALRAPLPVPSYQSPLQRVTDAQQKN